jgi:hypothetical protein
MDLTGEDVLGVVSRDPLPIGALGVAILGARGVDVSTAWDQPVGAFLASHGVSLSGLQKTVDRLVNDALVEEVRGAALRDLGLPTLGTKSGGRYFLKPLT